MTRSIEDRMDSVESVIVELRKLPGQLRELGSQFVQLQQDVRGEFSAIRTEFADVRDEIGSVRADMARAILDTEDRVLKVVHGLHADLVERIEAIPQRRPRTSPRARKKR